MLIKYTIYMYGIFLIIIQKIETEVFKKHNIEE